VFQMLKNLSERKIPLLNVSSVVRVKITRNYQLTTPAEVRHVLGIREGDVVEMLAADDRAVIVPLTEENYVQSGSKVHGRVAGGENRWRIC